ncbi:hypothetical protein T03_11928 [Trichinella britovi]|uniref:Uncharacterized protein n=1 Tax=Trichinella britovi TaxID=45882 RepID=A0A0V1CP92_TRIBR|nr:hypothetical protein T03_11928 [Trichinella britovi]
MRYREESGGQEHSDFSSCFFMLAISRFQSQLTDFPMYRLAEVEVAALYPRIREVTPNCRYQGCFKITDNGRPPELPLCLLKLEKYTRTFQYLYPYINNRLLAPACPPQRHEWYDLESTIHAPGSHGCQQSNVGTRRNYQYMFRFTSYKLLMARNTFSMFSTYF